MKEEGGAKLTKRKSKGVLLPFLATNNPIQDIVLAA